MVTSDAIYSLAYPVLWAYRNEPGPGGLLAGSSPPGPGQKPSYRRRCYCRGWLAARACSRASLALRRAASPRRTTRAM